MVVPDLPAKAKPNHPAKCSGGRGDCTPRARRQGRSDLDEAGEAQAERRVRGHGAALDLVAVQAQHLQPGEVHDVHDRAEAADGELWGTGGAGRPGQGPERQRG